MSKQNRSPGTTFEEMPISFKKFPTGSSYDGEFDALGMNGYGEYTFHNGVVYRGQFADGMFHGMGELVYNEGPEAKSVIRGRWVKGVLTERSVYFNGTLEYDEHAWQYIKFPDRRYQLEYETDVQPAGASHITPDVPAREIPFDFYDTEQGFYDPKTNTIYDYTRKSLCLRGPSEQEQKWILDNCRKQHLERIGPRPDLYETWTAPIEELPKRIKSRNPSLFNYGEAGGDFYDPSAPVDLQRFEKI